jgi:hypothetical protein
MQAVIQMLKNFEKKSDKLPEFKLTNQEANIVRDGIEEYYAGKTHKLDMDNLDVLFE